MLKLPKITLIACTGRQSDIGIHSEALTKSCEGIEWGAVKLIVAPEIKNIDDWNYYIVYKLHEHVTTDFAFLIHPDGYVINPGAWRDQFFDYDYVGAPWPLPQDDYSYRTERGEVVRVGNSVSLRSKRIMELPSRLGLEWKPYYGNTNEDGFLCVHNRRLLRDAGCKFAPMEVAKYFSKEHEIPENQGVETLAFHQVDI